MRDFQNGAFGDDKIIGHRKRWEKVGKGGGHTSTDKISVDGTFGYFFGEEDTEARRGGGGRDDRWSYNNGQILGIKGFSLSADAVSFEAERESILPGERHRFRRKAWYGP